MSSLRQKISMDKEWRFTHNHPKVSYDGCPNSYITTRTGNQYSEALPDFDDSNWCTVDLPHDWAVESEFGEQYLVSHGYKARGSGWYRKIFKMDDTFDGSHFLLCFCGVSNQCTVYFNGSIMARNFSGYNEFTVDITDRIYYGDRGNVLAVEVDAENIEGWFYEGAGIYRHVWLYIKNDFHIAHNGLWVNSQKMDDGHWDIKIETTVENGLIKPAVYAMISEIYEDNQLLASSATSEMTCAIGKTETTNQTMELDHPNLWDIDHPKLYRLVCRVLQDGREIDSDQTMFGCRTIAIIPDKGFFLNGRRVLIKGTCNHQDHAGIGVALPDSIHDYRIRKLKELGCNAYRCAHNTPARELLDACDRYGIIVMDENRHFESSSEVLLHVETMVRRDRNHPSVVFYSLFNEEPMAATSSGCKIYRRMKAVVERLDNTRFIMGGMNENTMMSLDGAALEMDITGFNYSLENFEKFHHLHPKQPIIGTENCAAYSTRGCYKSDRERHVLNCYDMEHESFFYTVRDTWKIVRKLDFIIGIFIWIGFDYRGEPSPFIWPSISTQFGLMDTCGNRKDAYYFVKACYNDEPMLHIMPHWNWSSGDTVKVMTVTNGDEAELFLNGRTLGRKYSDVYTQCEWEVPFEPGVLSAIAYKDGIQTVTAEVKTTGRPKKIRIEPDRPYINDNGTDTVPVNICVIDENGAFVPDADYPMRFELKGDGIILGTGNGNPNSHEMDKMPERDLFAGWCQVLVQADLASKALALIVSSDGFEQTVFQFEIRSRMVSP